MFDATPGGTNATSYVTVEDATGYLYARLQTEPWTEADRATQAAALQWATSLLDTQVQWYGTPTTTTQALAWPMTGQLDHLGRPIPSDVVPAIVQQATSVYALALLGDTTASASTPTGETMAVKSRRIGDTQIVYQDVPQSATPARPVSQGIPAEVRALLRPYGQMSGGLTVALKRT